MKEETLYDVVAKITEVVANLNYFTESQALDVAKIQDELLNIKAEIQETLD